MHMTINWAMRFLDSPEAREFHAKRLVHLLKTDPDNDQTHFLQAAFDDLALMEQGKEVKAKRWTGKKS